MPTPPEAQMPRAAVIADLTEEPHMMPITRRAFVAGTAAATATLAVGPHVHAQKKGGTLRVVPHADLKVLDPRA
jgi:hypothetical protein